MRFSPSNVRHARRAAASWAVGSCRDGASTMIGRRTYSASAPPTSVPVAPIVVAIPAAAT